MGEKLAGEPAQQPGDASQIQNHIWDDFCKGQGGPVGLQQHGD
jgi:hypothetical protein